MMVLVRVGLGGLRDGRDSRAVEDTAVCVGRGKKREAKTDIPT